MSDVHYVHYSIDFLCDDDGWWLARCSCGWSGGRFTHTARAVDALMYHARDEGYSQAMRGLAPQQSTAKETT